MAVPPDPPTRVSGRRSASVRAASLAGLGCGAAFGLAEAWRLLEPGALARTAVGGVAPLVPAAAFLGHALLGAAGLGLLGAAAAAGGLAAPLATWSGIGAFLALGAHRLAAVLSERQDPDGVRIAIECGAIALAGGLAAAALVARACARPAAGPPRAARRALGGLVTLTALLACAGFVVAGGPGGRGRRPPASGTPPSGPNLLLVSIDALRADALGCYGSSRPKTPNLDALAARGAVFERTFAAAPWTLASFAAAFGSAYPSECGLGRLGGERGRILDRFFQRRPRIPAPTLAADLAAAGYATEAAVTNVWFDARFGIDAGFDAYARLDRPGWPATLRPLVLFRAAKKLRPALAGGGAVRADRMTDAGIAALDGLRGRKFFLWLHYLDPHLPYDAPGSPHRVPQSWLDDLRSERLAPSAHAEEARAAYADEVAFADREIGRLLDHLRRTGLERETVVVVTADHGEEFWEQGGFEHGHALHDATLRVPLIVAFPDGRHAGRRVSAIASLLDLRPTLTEALGVRSPEGARGSSLLPLLSGEAGTGRVALSESLLYGDERKSLRSDRYRLILAPGAETPDVFDLSRDPGGAVRESPDAEGVRPLVARLREWTDAMTRIAAAMEASLATSPPDDEARRALRALGYAR